MKNKIFIAIPHEGFIWAKLVIFLFNLIQQGYEINLHLSHYRPVDSNRNKCVKAFLATDCTHLWFIDSDILPPVDALARLLAKGSHVSSIMCPTYQEKKKYILRKWVGDRYEEVKGTGNWMKVDATGFGCMLLSRHVVTDMVKQYGYFCRFVYIDGECVWGEDIDFCKRAKEKGYSVWVDTSVECGHYIRLNAKDL